MYSSCFPVKKTTSFPNFCNSKFPTNFFIILPPGCLLNEIFFALKFNDNSGDAHIFNAILAQNLLFSKIWSLGLILFGYLHNGTNLFPNGWCLCLQLVATNCSVYANLSFHYHISPQII